MVLTAAERQRAYRERRAAERGVSDWLGVVAELRDRLSALEGADVVSADGGVMLLIGKLVDRIEGVEKRLDALDRRALGDAIVSPARKPVDSGRQKAVSVIPTKERKDWNEAAPVGSLLKGGKK